jgi:hypothetical protein
MTEVAQLYASINGRDIGLGALLTRMQRELQRTNADAERLKTTLGGLGASGRGSSLPSVPRPQRTPQSDDTAREAAAALRLAQAEAQLLRAKGDLAGAAQTLERALAGQQARTVQVLGAQRQLQGVYNQTTRQAQQAATATERLAQRQAAVSSFARESGQALAGSLTAMVGPAAVATAAVAAIGQGVELAKFGAQVSKVTKAFEELAAEAGTSGEVILTAARAAAGGELDDLALKLNFNRAQLLGVADSAEEFSQLITIARDRAADMGISTADAMDSLVTGLGRGSAEILDNLGITIRASEAYAAYAAGIGKSVSALSDAEKKQAVINAVMAQTANAKAPDPDPFVQLATALENVRQEAAVLASLELGPIATELTGLLATLSAIGQAGETSGITPFIGQVLDLAQTFSVLNGVWQVSKTILDGFRFGLEEVGLVQSQTAATADTAAASQAAHDATVQALAKAYADGKISLEQHDAALAQLNGTAQGAIADGETLAVVLRDTGAAGADAVPGYNSAGAALTGLRAEFASTIGAAETLRNLLRGIGNSSTAALGGVNTTSRSFIARQRFGDIAGQAAQAAERAAVVASVRRTVSRFAAPETTSGRGGGGGGGARSPKVTAAQREQEQLLKGQQDYQNKSLDAAREYEESLGKIAEDYAKRRLEAQQKFDLNRLDSAVSFYDAITGLEDQDLARQLSARYEAAVLQAQDIANTKGADVADAFLRAQEQAIRGQGEREAAIAEAEGEGDTAEAERLRGLLDLQKRADDERLRQILEGNDTIAAAEAQAYSEAERRYAEHLDRMGVVYQRKFGGAAPGLAPPPPGESVPAPAAAAAPAAQTASAQPVVDIGAQQALDTGLGRLEAAMGAVRDGVAAVERRVGDVERAVGKLGNRSALGG